MVQGGLKKVQGGLEPPWHPTSRAYAWAIPIIDKSQFLKAISIIDKLSPINCSDKCCGKFSMCSTKFFFLEVELQKRFF